MKKNGYIAITSTILISIVLIVIILTISSVGFRGRANIFNSSSKAMSKYAAEGCIETAILNIAEDINYLGNEVIAVGNNECNILPIEDPEPSQKTIITESTVLNSKTILEVTINTNDFSILSWQEKE